MAIGMMIYASDADDRLQPSNGWMDATYSYVKNWDAYRCPSLPKGEYGYAFDLVLGGEKLPEGPSELPMIYESTDLSENATDWVASLPKRERHLSQDGKAQNSVAYADCHARSVPTGRP